VNISISTRQQARACCRINRKANSSKRITEFAANVVNRNRLPLNLTQTDYKRIIPNKIYHFANITADCPLIDPSLIDRVVDEYSLHRPDLARYDGDDLKLPFNCYVVSVPALEKICSSKRETDTEMWQKYFSESEQFKIHKIIAGERYQHETLKTSLDYPEDYEFMKKVFSELYVKDRQFSLLDVIRLTKKKPEILEINSSPDLVKRWRRHQELTTGNKLVSPVTGIDILPGERAGGR
jgi:hypothetical protein